MKYTIKTLQKEFPDDRACLDYIFRQKYDATGYYPIKGRKSYVNAKGHQIHPLGGTIFEKSRTPLTLWFHAIFLFASSKNGVSAKELQRQLGVTYKCAWRMGYQIRTLMGQGTDMLTGTVEIDETFYGKGGTNQSKYKKKDAILGMVERQGNIRVRKIPNRRLENILPPIKENVVRGARVMTDEYQGYNRLSFSAYGYRHTNVKHGKGHYTWGETHTNTIEGFWGQFKKSVRGTYAFVSSQHLQSYLNEFAYRYNHRNSSVPVFVSLVLKACV